MSGLRRIFPSVAAVLLMVGCGCATYDPVQTRRENNAKFRQSLDEQSRHLLTNALSLDDCIAIAMSNNYAVRQADLRVELHRIGKNVAFTAFLPTVAASAGYTSFAKQPNIMTEQRFANAELNIGMPIFMPSTWFLYAAARHGHAGAVTAAYYVRQGIVLQTTMDYCAVLAGQDTITALEVQLTAAQENAERITALAKEGFFRPWEAEQARLQAQARAMELNTARRNLTVSRGNLLLGLGLSADAPLTLSGEMGDIPVFTNSTETLVLQALEQHPTLAVADRQVVMQEHRVREAFCAFLPVLSVFSSGTWTGNTLIEHASNWANGFQAAWQLFDGLANVARYRAARVERQQSVFTREEAFLNVMIQVMAAEAALRDASEAAALRQHAYEVAAAKYADYDARSREGLLPLSDALDARAIMDLAQVFLVKSRHQERLAAVALQLALGAVQVPDNQHVKNNGDEQK